MARFRNKVTGVTVSTEQALTGPAWELVETERPVVKRSSRKKPVGGVEE